MWNTGRAPVVSLAQFLYVFNKIGRQERPYHDDNTASRLLSEVKHHRARLVLRWGTTLESRVLFFYSFVPFRFQHFSTFFMALPVLSTLMICPAIKCLCQDLVLHHIMHIMHIKSVNQ